MGRLRRSPAITNSRQIAWIGSGIAGVFLVANAIVSLQSARQLIRSDMVVDQAYQQLHAVDSVLLTLTDAETGQRGFVITGDVGYLEPYESACKRADQTLEILAQHCRGNIAQQDLIHDLRDLVERKLEHLSQVVSARRGIPLSQERLAVQNKGKILMDEIRNLIRRISDNAQIQLAQATNALEINTFRLKTAILLGMATGIILVIGTAYAMERHHRTRSLAEAALFESNRLSQSTLDALRSHIAILDETGMIIATNRAWRNYAEANGAGPALLSNVNYLEVCDRSAKLGSSDAATVAARIRAILDGRESEFEFEYPCKSKTESRWFQIRVSRFTGPGNIRLVVSHENITAIKVSQQETARAFASLRESHQALKASEQQYRALAEAMPQMVWSTLPCGTVDYFNQRWIEYTDCDTNPDLVDGWLEILHPDDREKAKQCWHAALKTGDLYSVEYRVRRASDGSYRWHLARGVPMRGPDGRITKWYGTTTDIDDQRRMNEELEAAKDAADAANRAKSEFLANMSHEIRTPMNGVLGMTELLLDTELSDEQRESLKLVKLSAESLMTIINDILDYSKIEAGHMELDPVEFELPDLLQDTLKPLAHRAHCKGLEVTCDISADVPRYVVGDPNRLRQVIINLVGNAIKFTDSGEVILQASMVSQSEEDCEIAFAVIDTGIGIAREKQIAIFDPFEQADTSTTRKYGGTGLGLSISSKLVALMGGKLAVSSKIGLGSKFFFQARFAQARLLKSPALDADLTKLAGIAVLIVDDNATNLRVLDEMLRQCRAVPRTATSGPEALEEFNRKLAAGEPYQLVLVDAVMPEMDGFTLVEQLCLNSSTTPPAIMMLTSADRQGDAARCRALGIASYLIKPIKAADLYHAISNCMDGRTSFGNIPTTTKVNAQDSLTKLEITPTFKILLAEDNPVNQLVAVGILENHGHQVTVANDGNEAISAYLSDYFDLVLMDVQMPVLDGLEATVKIRDLEITIGKHTPIIAMTSHAYKGDQQRCFDAGMDAYLSKPIVIPELLETIGRLAGSSQPVSQLQNQAKSKGDADSEIREPISDQLSTVDFEGLYLRVEHDLQLLDELIELFLETSPQMFLEIEAAVARRDRQAIERGTHALKGAMLNIGAESAAGVADLLEQGSREESFEQLNDSLVCLKSEMDRLVNALSSHQVSKQQ